MKAVSGNESARVCGGRNGTGCLSGPSAQARELILGLCSDTWSPLLLHISSLFLSSFPCPDRRTDSVGVFWSDQACPTNLFALCVTCGDAKVKRWHSAKKDKELRASLQRRGTLPGGTELLRNRGGRLIYELCAQGVCVCVCTIKGDLCECTIFMH